jgi:hypothetical protein
MTRETQKHRSLPEWATHAELLDAYLDGIQYERGGVSMPGDRPGILNSRLHSSDESAGRMAVGGENEDPLIHVRLELDLKGLHPDAKTSASADDDLIVFHARLIYRAEYTLGQDAQLPPEAERQQFIHQVVVPQVWLQMRHMADIVTAQTHTGRVLLPATPPSSHQAEDQ